MTDTIIKGTGNSRTLKTVPNAMATYPDFPSFLQAMIAGTFPIDIGPLNSAGLNVKGTDLNKATLLKDATAALYGLGTTATVDDVLALHFSQVETGLYRGNGSYGETHPNSLSFSFEPNIIFIYPGGAQMPSVAFFRGATFCAMSTKDANGKAYRVELTWNGNVVSWYSTQNAQAQMNEYNFNFPYLYLALK